MSSDRRDKKSTTLNCVKENNIAFSTNNLYLLASVLFQKQQKSASDLSAELVQVMTSL
jgi:hypothetical protein